MVSESKKNSMLSAPMSLQQFLDFGISISGRLDDIHKKDEIHGDIRPDNINWQPESLKIELADASEGVEAPLSSEVRLPYISPEQTGRMNRMIDYRTDFYSLGVVFYELLTGNPPFIFEDPLEIIHNHIAKRPLPLYKLNSEVPIQISKIVMRLLEKNAEDRYQTAYSLQTDLKTCLDQWQRKGAIEAFELGDSDFTGIFQIPQKLYGRKDEIESLLNSFERISAGTAEVFLVGGYSGVGKTALIHEVNKPITAKRGYFIEGKFDQYQRNIPYFAWGQAFDGLVRQLLMEDETRLLAVKSQILEAVGTNGKVLVDVIPNLELVIGPQHEVPQLGGQETQNRFNYLFQKFTKTVARPEHPLVVFLDDLQWIDSASLSLLKILLINSDQNHYLLIGAYRDNEVDATHPLMTAVAELEEKAVGLEQITLQNLAESDVNNLVADSLHCSVLDSGPLARLIYTKTAGNAFFTHQLLHTLDEENLLAYDEFARRWQWDMATLEAMDITDNVVDLMVTKLQRLPLDTQSMLKQAACIGNQFELAILTIITQVSEEVVRSRLQVALREGVISVLNNIYKFTHDRVQQAAYSLISEADKKMAHLEIGRQLLQYMPKQEKEENIFKIVDHLNIAESLITDPSEREAIAKLNLQAGQKAKASTAYSASLVYCKKGLDYLTDDCWRDQYALTLALYEGASEAASSDGQFQDCEQFVAEVEQHAESAMDKVNAYGTMLHATVYQGTCHEAIEMVLPVLDSLGSSLPAKPTEQDVEQQFVRLQSILTDINMESLAELPDMTDPRTLSTIRLLQFLWSSSYLTEANLAAMIAMEMTILSIQYGNAPESAFGYACFGAYLHGEKDNIDQAYEFGLLAARHLERPDAVQYQARTRVLVWTFILYCKQHLKNSIGPLSETFQIGVETGDIEFAAWSADNTAFTKLFVGKELSALKVEMEGFIESLFKINQNLAALRLQMYAQVVSNLLDYSENPSCLIGEYFNEDETLPDLLSKNLGLVLCEVYIYKLMLSYLFEEYRAGADSVESSAQYVPNLKATPNVPVYTLYASLTTLMVYAESSAEQRQTILQKVDAYQSQMKIWASYAPMNYLNKWHLVEAERLRVQGQDVDAVLEHYDRAIELAHENGYINEEALANELAAKFWLGKGRTKIASLYMKKANSCYQSWGARAKLNDLKRRYPQLLGSTDATPPEEAQAPTTGQAILDLKSVIKASQEIAGEIELKGLLANMMRIVIENAGAQKGVLVIKEEGQWIVVAEGDIQESKAFIQKQVRIDENDMVSQGIVNYVARTRENVVLEDAANKGEFTSDPTIQKRQAKSILCLPLVNQRQISGILYLENNLVKGAFTPERLRVLDIISGQAAISLKNAILFDSIQKEIRERKRAESERDQFFNKSIDMLSIAGFDGNFRQLNSAWSLTLGWTMDELLNNSWLSFVHPDDQQSTIEAGEQLKKGIPVVGFENRYRCKDGSYRWISWNSFPMLEQGQIFSVARDVMERKLAEEELEKSESKYRSLVDNSIVGVFSSNFKGEFIFVNKAMVKMFDFDSPEQMLAEGSLPRWADPERREKMLALLNEHGSVTNFEAESITNAGRHIYVLFSAKMFGENIFGMVMDITKRKEAEEALKISKTNLIKAQEVGRIGSWNLDLLENNLVWTDEIYRIFGVPIGTPMTYKKFIATVHPEDRDYVHRKWSAALEGKPYDIEHRLIVGNEVKWVREKAELSFDDKGTPITGVGITQDITERKQAEVELIKSYKEIEELQKQLQVESAYLQEEIKLEHNFENIIGNSNAIQYALFKVEQVAQTDSTVLILGETGTGKELVARAIHHNSQRKNRPLIKINCATLPANLIESELFGHEKGSFTGAAVRHSGRFEVADGSTLFLDEIGELPFELQAKLLRVLEDGEFERLGSTRTLKVDVRIIAATNRDLKKDAKEGRFRQDLWYRLNVFPITLPPLRDRIEDIPMIVQHYVDMFTRKLGKKINSIPEKVMKSLQNHTWPGNVRELQNVLERAVIGSSGAKLKLSEALSQSDKVQPEGFKSMYDMERDYIASVLEETGWKVSGKNSAAEILGLDRSTLRGRMKKLNIHK